MSGLKKPENPIDEFIAWQEHRYSWPIKWGPPSFLRLSRKNPLWGPCFLMILGGILLVPTVFKARQLIVAGPAVGESLFGIVALGVLSAALLLGGVSWLVASRRTKPGSRGRCANARGQPRRRR
jgi:hypothetical protein